MGLWERHLLPRVINAYNNSPDVRQVRERMCGGLSGEVVEIGFGSGLNAPTITGGRRGPCGRALGRRLGLAAGRVAASRVPVERIGLDAQALPLPDHSVDCALSTWTLCTIPTLTRRWPSCAACSSPAAG